MGLWETLLQPAALGGVVLPIVRRSISGGRDFARKRLPYQAGQEIEDTGRLPRSIDIEVELYNDMDEDDLYPDRYEALIAVLQDDVGQSAVVWADPVWGDIDVKVTEWRAEENAQDRDGVQLSISMEENGFLEEVGLNFSLLQTSDRSTAATEAAEFDALIDELASGEDIEQAWADAGFKKKGTESTSFAAQIDGFTKALDAGLQRADDVIRLVNVIQARTEAVMRLDSAVGVVAGWEILDRGARLIDAVAKIGEDVVSSAVRIVEITTNSPTSATELAAQLYGDATRADEILQANPQANPIFIVVGTVLQVLET